MSIRSKIITASAVIGVFQGIVLIGSVLLYAAQVTDRPIWEVSQILALFPGFSIASVLAPIVFASFVISVLLLIGYIHYVFLSPIDRYKIAAEKVKGGDIGDLVETDDDDELSVMVRSYVDAIKRLKTSYDQLSGSLHGQYAVLGHDAEILRLLVDHLPLGVFLQKEPDFEIMRMNERAAQLIGKNTLMRSGISSFCKLDSSPYPFEELPNVVVQKTKILETRSDIYFRYPDMRMAAFRMTSVPVLDANNRLLYVISTLLDITDMKEVEREKSDFVSLASHQLRTPISIINWYVELLNAPEDMEHLTEDQRGFITQIKESSARMSKLIDTLLNASRIELGTFKSEGTMFDIVQVADIAIRDTMALAHTKHQTIEKSYDLNTPLIYGEPKLGQVVMQNLLSNAVKYTGDGGLIKVGIESHEEDKSAHVYVEDNGIGIPDDESSRIFSRFYRATNARDVDSSGSGLGLSIVRSLLEKAGGKITFKKIETGGTRFDIILPFTCKNI